MLVAVSLVWIEQQLTQGDVRSVSFAPSRIGVLGTLRQFLLGKPVETVPVSLMPDVVYSFCTTLIGCLIAVAG
jgi:hypothetical protein